MPASEVTFPAEPKVGLASAAEKANVAEIFSLSKMAEKELTESRTEPFIKSFIGGQSLSLNVK